MPGFGLGWSDTVAPECLKVMASKVSMSQHDVYRNIQMADGSRIYGFGA